MGFPIEGRCSNGGKVGLCIIFLCELVFVLLSSGDGIRKDKLGMKQYRLTVP